LEMRGPRILLVKLSAVGDVVHCLPIPAALKGLYPESIIEWLVEEAAADLITGHPLLSRVWISPRKRLISEVGRKKIQNLNRILHLARELRLQPFDMVLDLQGLYKSAAWTRWVRSPRKIGWSHTREYTRFSLTETIGPENFRLHAVDRYLDFIRNLGGNPTVLDFRIPTTREHAVRVDDLMTRHGLQDTRFIAVNPVAQWDSKLWEPASFGVLMDRIHGDLGMKPVLTGSSADRAYAGRIRKYTRTPWVDLCGKTSLKDLTVLYRRSALVISTDTGPMHIAAAVGTPVVALFGPTDSQRTGPYGPHHRIVRTGISCSPCFRRSCDHRSCMRDLSPDQVFGSVRDLLRNP